MGSSMPKAPACVQGHQASSLRSSEEFPADKENQQVLQQQQQPDAEKQGSRVPGLEALSDEQLAHEAVYALQASGRLLAWDTAAASWHECSSLPRVACARPMRSSGPDAPQLDRRHCQTCPCFMACAVTLFLLQLWPQCFT